MICPYCRLHNPPSALRCDCGWDFASRTFQQPYAPPRRPDRNALQWFGYLGTLGLTASMVTALIALQALFGSDTVALFAPAFGWFWTVPVALLLRRRWPDVSYGMAVAGATLLLLGLPFMATLLAMALP